MRVRETLKTCPADGGFRHELVRVTTEPGPFGIRPSRRFYLVRVGVDAMGVARRTLKRDTLEEAERTLAEVAETWEPPGPPPPGLRPTRINPDDWVKWTPAGWRGLGD